MSVEPKSLRIVHHPAEILRRKAAPIESITDEVRTVAARMLELMFDAPGIGLAAPQVGLPWRMFVCHVARDPEDEHTEDPPDFSAEPMVVINPTLSEPSRDLVPYEEGCLSLPEIMGDVRRPSEITLTAHNERGEEFTMRASGLLARCWQHEYDHLDGILIIDKMTVGARLKNRRAIRELERGIA